MSPNSYPCIHGAQHFENIEFSKLYNSKTSNFNCYEDQAHVQVRLQLRLWWENFKFEKI